MGLDLGRNYPSADYVPTSTMDDVREKWAAVEIPPGKPRWVLRGTGRALLGVYFALPGLSKLVPVGYRMQRDLMIAWGVPFPGVLLVVAGVVELVGGVFLVAGYKQRPAALLLALLVLCINLGVHSFWRLPDEGYSLEHEAQNFVKNLAVAAGLLFVAGAAPVPEKVGGTPAHEQTTDDAE